MGVFAPPSPKCYALDKIEFSNFLFKSLVLRDIFRQKCRFAPSKTNFWLPHFTQSP